MAYGRISLEQALNSDNFYQLPKVVIKSKYYRKLKAEAKLMFMLCRDRLSASLDSTRKGDLRFVDDLGDIFIYYNIEGGKQVSYIDMIDSTEEPPFSDDAPGSSGGSDLKRPALRLCC